MPLKLLVASSEMELQVNLPGLYLWGFLTPPVEGADLRAAFEASCLRGALPPVDLPEDMQVRLAK